jgi:hypothetical protein
LASLNAVIRGQNLAFLGTDTSYWIGLNKIDMDKDKHTWIDGSPFAYQNWDLNQPDYVNKAEDCVEMRSSGKWRDAFCYTNKAWFCTIQKGVDPNTTTFEIPIDTFKSTNYCFFLISILFQ